MKHTKYALLALDALCAGVLALGAALVLLPGWGLPAPAVRCGLAVGALLVFLALWERFPWQVPALAGGCLALAGIAAGMMGKLPELPAAAEGYIRWAVEESLGGNPQPVVYLGACLPATAVFWLLMRRLPSLWAVTLLAAGLIGYQALARPEGWQLPFVLLLAGVILFLPRANLKGPGRLQAQLLAAALAAPVLGLAFLLGPSANGQWRSTALGYLVQDVQDFWEYHWGELPALPITSMRSMGLQPQGDRLGGDRELDEAPALSANQNLLLRGQALEVYTGAGWEDIAPQENGNFRFDSVFWRGRRADAFGTALPKEAPPALLDELLVDVDADLRTLRNFRSLFLPYRAQWVEVKRGGSELFFNMQGEAYWQSQPQASVEYHVEGRAWNFRDEGFDRNMLRLETALAGLGGDPASAGVQRCLQLPDALPEEVGALARDLTRELSSPYAKAAALRDWLAANCTYTLTPGPADPDQDFVAAFLADRKGYCTYYASALTVLCRCAGVPARYVTGYGMTPEGRRWQATQATAHAWTEVYLAHIGWVPLDALGQEIFLQEAPVPEESQSGGAAMGQPATPPPERAAPGELPVAEPRRFNPLLLLWLVPAVLAVGGIAAGKALRARRYTLPYVRRRFPQTGPAAEHCYRDLVRLLGLMGLAPQPGETLLAFWERAAERLTFEDGVSWREAGRILDRLRFGGIAPTEEDIALLCAMDRALRERVHKRGRLLDRLRI